MTAGLVHLEERRARISISTAAEMTARVGHARGVVGGLLRGDNRLGYCLLQKIDCVYHVIASEPSTGEVERDAVVGREEAS